MKLEIYSNSELVFLGGGEEKVRILENTLSPSSDLKKGGYNAVGVHALMHPQIYRQMWYSQTYDGRSQCLGGHNRNNHPFPTTISSFSLDHEYEGSKFLHNFNITDHCHMMTTPQNRINLKNDPP